MGLTQHAHARPAHGANLPFGHGAKVANPVHQIAINISGRNVVALSPARIMMHSFRRTAEFLCVCVECTEANCHLHIFIQDGERCGAAQHQKASTTE